MEEIREINYSWGKKTNTGQPGTDDRTIQVACQRKKKKKVPTPFLLICGSKASLGTRERGTKRLIRGSKISAHPYLPLPALLIQAAIYLPLTQSSNSLHRCFQCSANSSTCNQVLQSQTFLSGACLFTEHLKTSTFK